MNVFDNTGWVCTTNIFDDGEPLKEFVSGDDQVRMGGSQCVFYPTNDQITKEGYDYRSIVYIRAVQLLNIPRNGDYDYPNGFYHVDTWINGSFRGYSEDYNNPAADGDSWFPKDPSALTEADGTEDGIAFFYSFPRQPKAYTVNIGGYCAFQTGSDQGYFASFEQGTTVTIPALESWKITFNYNGGNGKTKSMTKYYGLSEKFPVPSERTDYTFLGWREEGKTDLHKAGDALTENRAVTYVAQWEKIHTPPMITSSSISRGVYDEATEKWTYEDDGEYFMVQCNVKLEPGSKVKSVAIDTGNGNDHVVKTKTTHVPPFGLFAIDSYCRMDSADMYGSRKVSVSISDGILTTSIILLLSSAAYAVHVVGDPGTDTFGLSVNAPGVNGDVKVKAPNEIKLYSQNGITYNDGPFTLYDGKPIYGEVNTGRRLKDNIDKYIAVDLFCSDDEGHQFMQRFVRDGEKWPISGRYLLYCVYSNPDDSTQYVKSEEIALFRDNDPENGNPSYVKIKGVSCVGSITAGTVTTSTVEQNNWYIKINKIVGHTTLLGLTTADGGTGSGGHEYFAGYGLKLIGRTFSAEIAKADLDKVDDKINSIPITFIEGM